MIIEQGIPVGNTTNKNEETNPLAKKMVKGFHDSVYSLIDSIHQKELKTISEVGCGEGYLSSFIDEKFDVTIKGCDFSTKIIEIANQRHTGLTFYVKDIYSIGEEEKADLIVCCEVLEHLEYPERALKSIHSIAQKYVLLSVPNEPLWRVLNMARLKYLSDFGNTPGHLNHWSTRQFKSFVSEYFEIIKVKTPLPWTMILAKKK